MTNDDLDAPVGPCCSCGEVISIGGLDPVTVSLEPASAWAHAARRRAALAIRAILLGSIPIVVEARAAASICLAWSRLITPSRTSLARALGSRIEAP